MKAEEREIRRKQRVLNHAVESGNVAKTCRYFGIPRSLFYRWRNAYPPFSTYFAMAYCQRFLKPSPVYLHDWSQARIRPKTDLDCFVLDYSTNEIASPWTALGAISYSRPGGASPICYDTDVTDAMVEAYREQF